MQLLELFARVVETEEVLRVVTSTRLGRGLGLGRSILPAQKGYKHWCDLQGVVSAREQVALQKSFEPQEPLRSQMAGCWFQRLEVAQS